MDSNLRSQSTRTRFCQGYTLVEMLVVISIVGVLAALASAGFRSIQGSGENGQVSDIANTISRARAYAMANNTYVFVGIQEVSVANAAGTTQTAGTGRIAVSVMASRDGTLAGTGYQKSSSTSTMLSSLNVVMPLRHYDNLHLLTSPGAGLSNLPNTATSGATSNVASTTALTMFAWPQYPAFGSNGTVIQFNPQGEAQIVTGAYTDQILQWIEIDLAPTQGTVVSGKNPATILVDGASGSVTTYRE